MFVWSKPSFVVRKILISASSTPAKKVFLTFDDGPCPQSTPAVLELLSQHKVQTTFFVIGRKAAEQKELLQKILSRGHSVFSHSSDHNYMNYFKSESLTQNWLSDSVNELNKLTEQKRWAFRPPAGILTPPVLKAAQNLQMPLILWNQRFFDGVFALKQSQVQKRLSQIEAGDIILLHDRQSEKKIQEFLKTLEFLIVELKKLNFEMSALTDNDIRLNCRFN